MLHPPNPNTHPDWLAPHSLAWYTQLGEMTGEYVYPWRSTITEPNGESLFMEEIDDTFDCAYNRKGPTSAYPDIARVVKRGGSFIGLHPGDQLSAIEQHMGSVMPIFDHYATSDGLPTTHMYYLVRAIV